MAYLFKIIFRIQFKLLKSLWEASVTSKRTQRGFRQNTAFNVRCSKLLMATFIEISKMHIFVVVIMKLHSLIFKIVMKKMFSKESKSTK